MVSNSLFRFLLQKGGIRLRLMIVIVGLVASTAFILSAVVFPRQEAAIRSKAFNVCEVSALSISSSAGEALLTDQVLLLEDIIRSIQSQNVDGLLEISVISKNRFFAHSQPQRRGAEAEPDILARTRAVTTGGVTHQEINLKQDGIERSAYEFLTPIKFQEKILGYTRIVYDQEAIQAPIRKARLVATVVALATLLASFPAIFFVSGRLAKPILQVAGAAKRVGEGDLDVRVNIQTLDEVGILADRFNHMVIEIKEKLHMSKFVSGSTIEMIKTRISDSEMKLGGTRQDTAFLFSDVRGFTAWSEKTSPEAVVHVLNEYLDLQTQIIEQFGGDVDKYVGDEIMAVFTGPDKEDHCLHAAVGIIQALKTFNNRREKEGETILTVGIGCHSGEVVVGNVGSKNRMDYTAIGDAVNLSARLCSTAEALQIVTTRAMLSRTRKNYRLWDLEPIKVKGKEQAIPIAGVLNISDRLPAIHSQGHAHPANMQESE